VADDGPAILGRYVQPGGDRDVPVRLLNFPLQVFAAARQHHDELLREFALLALQPPRDESARTLPAELLDLIDTLGRRYGGVGDRADTARDAALARGELSMDLTYQVPVSVGPAMSALHQLMEAADAFCRDEQLLTLAATPVERRFRLWFIEQFISQAADADPVPWDGPLSVDEPALR
jgi:hypothetical protein